ncbi:squalene synthase HpnC [Pseudonocardia halophobica]|uniref:Phytoene synthase n=1 Tax=Pseudonocardia halophobica TaxID=29401 RepID=A0A9W6NY27_9PSEU|nr:squalene synthase HpnC [Pseudonocardia halophobica]GLL13301.1 phytoene synthase [Pseudonocardia halophobica]
MGASAGVRAGGAEAGRRAAPDPSAVVPADPAGADRLRAAESAENFPVAMRVLPTRYRRRLRAVYDVVRMIDDLGDEGAGTPAERIAALEAFRADLHAPAPTRPVLRRLAEVAPDLPAEPFDRLLDANVLDQQQSTYDTWDALLGYCALSADPIGRLVLAIFEVPADGGIEHASDAVCTALQLLEHLQDVREDRGRGRIYLPAADRAAFGVTEADLDRPVATAELRALVRHETQRAEQLLDAGTPIVGALHGWARLAVAGYVAGGRAAADALHRVDGEVLGRAAEAAHSRKRDVLRHLPAVLLQSRRPGRPRGTRPRPDLPRPTPRSCR